MKRSRSSRELYERWKGTDLSLKAYAEREQVPYTTLCYWRRREKTAKSARAAASAEDAPGLVPVHVIEGDSAAACFEVRLSNGSSLRVPSGFDAPELERLLGILARC